MQTEKRLFPAMILISLVGMCAAESTDARLIRIEVERVIPAPAMDGAPPYDILHGRFYGELDPAASSNALITDMGFAPRNARGRIEYSASFSMARPRDPGNASGILLYDVPNRGNGTVTADREGHIRVISGWQGDLPDNLGLQTIHVPVAREVNGKPLTGMVLARFVDMPAGSPSIAITGSIGGPIPLARPLSLNNRGARLYVQAKERGSLKLVPASEWRFADCAVVAFPGSADASKLCLRGGFENRFAYTLVYRGRDPKVLGIGFAATRDLISFLRYRSADDAGSANPASGARWAIAFGTSQSGNFLKSFVNLDFNADEDGRIVFDGINPNIAARQIALNLRFGIPGGAAREFEPGSEGTLWWGRYDDRIRGRGTSSLLDRCTVSGTCPKVVETFGSAEFWGLRMSPALVGTDAKVDLPLPPNVRRYYFPSVTHGGSWTGGGRASGDPVPQGCVLAGNPNPMIEGLRAARHMLIEWVRDGREPRPSNYPTLGAGDLVEGQSFAMGWPTIPGAPTPEGKLNRFTDQFYGAGIRYHDLSGVASFQPPKVRRDIPLLVPRVDADGNEVAGIRSVELMVPLGTYTGWNVQAEGFGKGGGCSFVGGFIPFKRTRAERLAVGDPRPSLEERYQDRDGYLKKVAEVIEQQQAAGWLLPDDAGILKRRAEAGDVLR